MNGPGTRSPEELVLILTPAPEGAGTDWSPLAEAGISGEPCGDLCELCRKLSEGAGALVLSEEVRDLGDASCLVEALAEQPAWSDVPVLLLASGGVDSPAAGWAMEHLGNVTVLERPARMAAVVSALRTALRARRRQYELRNRLQQIRASEERFRLAAEAVNGLIYELDVSTGHVERSRGLCEVLGYRTEDVPPTLGWWVEQMHPDDRSWVVGPGRTWESAGSFQIEYRVRHQDGRWMHVEDHALVILGPDGRPTKFVGFRVDVTERRRAESALQRSEAEYRSLFEMVGTGNAEVDLDSGRFVRVNRRYCEMLGYSAEELLGGMSFLAVTHPDDRGWNREAIAPFLRDEQDSFEIEKRYVRKDGSVIWVHLNGTLIRDAHGRPTRLLGSALDISDRRQAQEELKTRTAQLDFALASTGVGRWLNTMPLGDLNWDERTKELFFIPSEAEPTIDLFYGRLHPDDREPTRRAIEAALRDRTLYAIDHRAVHPETGVVRWIRSAGQATYGSDGNPVRFDGVNYDITESKRLEEDLRQAAAELAEADRRKDEFLATLAHELRNPLAPVRNAVEILYLTGPATPDLEWATDLIDRQMRQMTRLIDDLLDVSRITRGRLEIRRERIELAKVIEGAVETSRPLIRQHGHELTVRLPDEPIRLEGDLTRLSQVFLNLLTNAAKYTDPGGRISLAASRRAGELVVEVRDSGIGIPAEKLPTLFDMFSQVEDSLSRSQGGLGIGLCLVKRLVEMHGGSIEAHSEGRGRGSTFVVHLPIVVGTGRAAAAREVGRRDNPGASFRILVVDDNQDAANSLARMLRVLGNELRIAYDGEAAVQAAGEFLPDLVLLDLGLPKLNGYDACRRIRQEPWGKEAVLIAVTGWGQEEDRRRSRESGFNDHLVKPVDPQHLKKLLNDLRVLRA